MKYNQQYKIVVANIKRLRAKYNMSQPELARRIGVSTSLISHIEHFRKDIALEKLCDIALVFDVRPVQLLRDPSEKRETA